MGKKKRGKRNNSSNNAVIPHHRVAGGQKSNAIQSCPTTPTESIECKSPNEELQEEVFPTATTTLSIGDTVKIKGLVNASEYNGMTGVIVGVVDTTTNRCGVRITGKSAKVMAIQ